MFFSLCAFLFCTDRYDPEEWGLSPSLLRFLEEDGFEQALSQIRQNSSSPGTFEKRFFQYFNAFKILKFLNYSHPRFYDYQDLTRAWADLKAATT